MLTPRTINQSIKLSIGRSGGRSVGRLVGRDERHGNEHEPARHQNCDSPSDSAARST